MAQSRNGGYCYFRNGTTSRSTMGEAYQPCNNSTQGSACCGTNHEGAGDIGVANDRCLPNGLCQNFVGYDPALNNEGQQLWWRQGCTDPTWQSPYCLGNVCNGTEYAFDNAPVRNCGGNAWCCGDETCCQTASNIFQLAATVGPSSSVPSETPASSTSTSTLTSTSTSPSATSSHAETPTSRGLSTGAKAGVGVGAAVVVLVAILTAFLLFRRRKSKSAEHDQTGAYMPSATSVAGMREQKQSQIGVHECDGNETVEIDHGHITYRYPAELWGNDAPRELDA
ncbi:hypothetical protein C7974DRAFT_131060 [Boeremia exigua]|uniref:uncharacterized protein n=1 Tax=Boeremia exigua TaxID=749465 RepID=UPI001E8D09E0|nr:uncharacterized protein C7974DRAFT_131060 [Boeremia exigua]KAH6639422.1 hypothetical protein C7974DRAFT_131060 [Boeremia exigua]